MSGKKASRSGDHRFSQALEVYERAMKALGKRNYEKAQQHLDALLSSFPEEREIAERARAYRQLCERVLEKRPSAWPKTVEDLLNHGVYHHNRGEFEQALKYLGQAQEIAPDNENVLYCVAATSARAGNAAEAIEALRSAITASPTSRSQARGDSDFDALRDDEGFVALLQTP